MGGKEKKWQSILFNFIFFPKKKKNQHDFRHHFFGLSLSARSRGYKLPVFNKGNLCIRIKTANTLYFVLQAGQRRSRKWTSGSVYRCVR